MHLVQEAKEDDPGGSKFFLIDGSVERLRSPDLNMELLRQNDK